MRQSFQKFTDELMSKKPLPEIYQNQLRGKKYVSRTKEITKGDYIVYDTTEEDGLILRITRKISPNTKTHPSLYDNICEYCIDKSERTNRWLPHDDIKVCDHIPYHYFVSVEIIGKTLARQFADEKMLHKTQLTDLNTKLRTLEQQETQKNQLLSRKSVV